MSKFPIRILALTCALIYLPAAAAQNSCGWMSTSKLNSLLAQAAPWQVMVGGAVGSCKFVGSGSRGATVIGANQMVKGSAADAIKTAKSLRAALGESYRIEEEPALGEFGFRYYSKGAGEVRSVSYVGHYKNVALTGQLVLPVNGDSAAAREGAVAFMRAALAVADDGKTIAAATQCPYFDEAIMRKLLPGKAYSQQVLGTNSCMAQDGSGGAMVLSIMEAVSADTAARMRGAGCRWDELAPNTHIGHSCQGGKPRLELLLVREQKLLRYAYAPGREPSAAERKLLEEMASSVRGK